MNGLRLGMVWTVVTGYWLDYPPPSRFPFCYLFSVGRLLFVFLLQLPRESRQGRASYGMREVTVVIIIMIYLHYSIAWMGYWRILVVAVLDFIGWDWDWDIGIGCDGHKRDSLCAAMPIHCSFVLRFFMDL